MENLTQNEKAILIFAINHFGTQGHPLATVNTLEHFTQPYAKMCLKNALDSNSLKVPLVINEISKLLERL